MLLAGKGIDPYFSVGARQQRTRTHLAEGRKFQHVTLHTSGTVAGWRTEAHVCITCRRWLATKEVDDTHRHRRTNIDGENELPKGIAHSLSSPLCNR